MIIILENIIFNQNLFFNNVFNLYKNLKALQYKILISIIE